MDADRDGGDSRNAHRVLVVPVLDHAPQFDGENGARNDDASISGIGITLWVDARNGRSRINLDDVTPPKGDDVASEGIDDGGGGGRARATTARRKDDAPPERDGVPEAA
jgi:hypothetical protein